MARCQRKKQSQECDAGIFGLAFYIVILVLTYHHYYLCGTKEQVSAGHPWRRPKRWR